MLGIVGGVQQGRDKVSRGFLFVAGVYVQESGVQGAVGGETKEVLRGEAKGGQSQGQFEQCYQSEWGGI